MVTATSSASAPTSRAKVERAVSRPLDPVVPRRPAVVPPVEIVLVRSPHGIREGPLRAGVDVDEPLEDREARAASGDGANGQGRPFAGLRSRGDPRPCPRGPAGRSRGRSHDRRSRATRLHSARRSSIATPAACTCWMISKFRSTRIGARPIDGSSISSSVGRDISARPIATICCSPPESVPANCVRR